VITTAASTTAAPCSPPRANVSQGPHHQSKATGSRKKYLPAASSSKQQHRSQPQQHSTSAQIVRKACSPASQQGRLGLRPFESVICLSVSGSAASTAQRDAAWMAV